MSLKNGGRHNQSIKGITTAGSSHEALDQEDIHNVNERCHFQSKAGGTFNQTDDNSRTSKPKPRKPSFS